MSVGPEQTTRGTIAASLAIALEWADYLFERTNERYRLTMTFSDADRIILMFGSRTRNGLRTLSKIHDLGIDDQMLPITRYCIDEALDLVYLRTPTIRKVNKKLRVPVSVEDKVRLFREFRYIKHGAIRKGRTLTPEHVAAMDFRKRVLRSSSTGNWQALGHREMVLELACALRKRDRGLLLGISHQWKTFSYASHPNPYEQMYFHNVARGSWRSVTQLKERIDENNIFQAAVMAAAFVLLRWALTIEPCDRLDHAHDIFESILTPLPSFR